MKNWQKIISYILAYLVIAFVSLYWIMDMEWARKPSWLCLSAACLYNCFLNLENGKKGNDEK